MWFSEFELDLHLHFRALRPRLALDQLPQPVGPCRHDEGPRMGPDERDGLCRHAAAAWRSEPARRADEAAILDGKTPDGEVVQRIHVVEDAQFDPPFRQPRPDVPGERLVELHRHVGQAFTRRHHQAGADQIADRARKADRNGRGAGAVVPLHLRLGPVHVPEDDAGVLLEDAALVRQVRPAGGPLEQLGPEFVLKPQQDLAQCRLGDV